MKKLFITLIAFAVLLMLIPDSSNAIPAFARKYGFNCNMCHTSFTKLNDFGQRYRDFGYQMPGQAAMEKNVFDTPPPLALRTSVGMVASHHKKNETSSFGILGLDLLAAGVLHKNISFLMIYTPRIDEPAGTYEGPQNGANPSQTGALESASIVFSNLVTDALNVRIGRFEPAYHAISSKRSYYLLQGYEIYGFVPTQSNSFSFDDNQIGLELTGHLKNGFHYAAGLINGTGANPDNNKQKDLYADIYQVCGHGEGQSAGYRVGAFGYLGWQPLTVPGGYEGPIGETNGIHNKKFYRLGGDISLNYKTFNLRTLLLFGGDDKSFNDLKPTEEYKYSGGIIELDYAGLMNNRLMASALYNWVSPPSYDNARKLWAFSALVRYYLGDWTAVNVALHAEYTHRQTGDDAPLKEDNLGLLLDFAF